MNQQRVNEPERDQHASAGQPQPVNGLQSNEAVANEQLLVQGHGMNSAGAQMHQMGQYEVNYYQPQMLMRVSGAQAGAGHFDPQIGGLPLQGQPQPVAGGMM